MKEAIGIVDAIKKAKKIVITSHRSPDGDSVGSSMAMYHFIQALGKDVVICHPDPSPGFLNWVKGDVEILDALHQFDQIKQIMEEADLIFALDYNGSSRMGSEMGALFDESSAMKVMIDHHPQPDDFVDIAVSRTDVCSTCQLVYELIHFSGNSTLIDQKIGEAVYLGIMTDTGSFRYSSVTSRTHEILAQLIEIGVQHTKVHESTYDNVPLNRLKLRGYAMSSKIEVVEGYPIALIWLSADELDRFDYQKGDTEGMVNIALSVEGVKVAVFFSEKNGQVKISFRSKDKIPVNKIASDHFQGGGHLNAAGGISNDPLESVVDKFKSLVPEYFEKNEV